MLTNKLQPCVTVTQVKVPFLIMCPLSDFQLIFSHSNTNALFYSHLPLYRANCIVYFLFMLLISVVIPQEYKREKETLLETLLCIVTSPSSANIR